MQRRWVPRSSVSFALSSPGNRVLKELQSSHLSHVWPLCMASALQCIHSKKRAPTSRPHREWTPRHFLRSWVRSVALVLISLHLTRKQVYSRLYSSIQRLEVLLSRLCRFGFGGWTWVRKWVFATLSLAYTNRHILRIVFIFIVFVERSTVRRSSVNSGPSYLISKNWFSHMLSHAQYSTCLVNRTWSSFPSYEKTSACDGLGDLQVLAGEAGEDVCLCKLLLISKG